MPVAMRPRPAPQRSVQSDSPQRHSRAHYDRGRPVFPRLGVDCVRVRRRRLRPPGPVSLPAPQAGLRRWRPGPDLSRAWPPAPCRPTALFPLIRAPPAARPPLAGGLAGRSHPRACRAAGEARPSIPVGPRDRPKQRAGPLGGPPAQAAPTRTNLNLKERSAGTPRPRRWTPFRPCFTLCRRLRAGRTRKLPSCVPIGLDRRPAGRTQPKGVHGPAASARTKPRGRRRRQQRRRRPRQDRCRTRVCARSRRRLRAAAPVRTRNGRARAPSDSESFAP